MILTPVLAAAYSVLKSYSEYSPHSNSTLIWVFISFEALLSLLSVIGIEFIIIGIVYKTVKTINPSVRKDIESSNKFCPVFKKVFLNSHKAEVLGYILLLNLYLNKNIDLELGYIHGVLQPLLAVTLLICTFVLITKLIYFGASLVNLENVNDK